MPQNGQDYASRVSETDVGANDFKHEVGTTTAKELDFDELRRQYMNARHRVFFLDYDGTLSPIVKSPELAVPSEDLLDCLKRLCSDPHNSVYIISGRDRLSLDKFVGHLRVGLSCEHGCFFRPIGDQQWRNMVADHDFTWKTALRPIMEKYTARVPNSFIENKATNLTYHYRQAPDQDVAYEQAKQLYQELKPMIDKFPIEVREGRKTVEIRPRGVNKGGIIRMILKEIESKKEPIPDYVNDQAPLTNGVDFVFCMGDDETDEDMFEEIERENKEEGKAFISCRVGTNPTKAHYYLKSQQQVLKVLQTLVQPKHL
eukprot:GEZU01002213.1.p1 GENE.GEZU01002213.1~~GEZU01002213.1.p1  ORF type:complete len:315 (-),score=50.49 GEZU01002213.1:17-961(-)